MMRHGHSSVPGIGRSDEDLRSTLGVVIVYDDVPGGQRAMHTLTDLAREFGGQVELRPWLWRFELLANPDWRAVATAQAVNADMLIISATSKRGLPPPVEGWIEECLAPKRGTGAAVVALLGPEGTPDKADSPRLQFVRRAARKAGLDFFAPQPGHEDSVAAATRSIHRRAETVTRTLDEILHPPAPRRRALRGRRRATTFPEPHTIH